MAKSNPKTPPMLDKSSLRPVRYDDVLNEILAHHPSADVDYLARAWAFGAKAHHGQKRKSGEPYFSHPIAVAHILAKAKLDLVTVAAGFLHDVVEDCAVERKELVRLFGEDLAEIVDGVTKIGKVQFRDRQQAQAENYRKMILAMTRDIRVLIVKLADRLHNMRTLFYLPEEKRRRISEETLDIYAPLAHRIGISHFKIALEELAFFYLEPEAYWELDRQLAQRAKMSRHLIDTISAELKTILNQNQLDAEVTSRIKSRYSIHRKIVAKETVLEGIFDYYAFRIMTNTVKDCYAALGVLHERWRPIPGRFKDFIATPKVNLYQSLHTTLIGEQGIPFEVQIRTHRMHRTAEEGVAAHWTYKDGRLTSVGKDRYTAWLRKLADEHEEVKDTHEFLATIKDQLQPDEVLVFTPAGEIKSLRAGATALDFAYSIHTELGHRTTGVKVNGKLVGLGSALNTGDIVEVLSSPKQTPNQEWLKSVKTPSARNKIRAWLRTEEQKKSIELGKNMFERELKRYKVPLKSISKETIGEHLPDFGFKKVDDFFSAIGFGRLTPLKAVTPFLPEDARVKPDGKEVRESRLESAIKRITKRSGEQVLVKGQRDVLVYLAKCCNPIIGDSITGYISRGRGVAVHKTDCAMLKTMAVNPERRIHVEWDRHCEPQLFRVRIRVYTEERPAMIADVSHAIADTKTNVKQLKASVNNDKNMGVFDIVLEIHSLDHLEKVFKRLRAIKGVLSQERLS